MTPILYGRWQTRIFLLGTIGVLVTLFYGWMFDEFQTPFVILGYVLIFGFFWDMLYNYIQTFRWDRDWPPAFQLGAGIIEGAFVWLLLWAAARFHIFESGSLPGVNSNLSFLGFFLHYSTVWVTTFLFSQSFMRILFPRWRFQGGKWL